MLFARIQIALYKLHRRIIFTRESATFYLLRARLIVYLLPAESRKKGNDECLQAKRLVSILIFISELIGKNKNKLMKRLKVFHLT